MDLYPLKRILEPTQVVVAVERKPVEVDLIAERQMAEVGRLIAGMLVVKGLRRVGTSIEVVMGRMKFDLRRAGYALIQVALFENVVVEMDLFHDRLERRLRKGLVTYLLETGLFQWNYDQVVIQWYFGLVVVETVVEMVVLRKLLA